MFDVEKEERELKRQYSNLGTSLQFYQHNFITHITSLMLFKHGMVNVDVLHLHPQSDNIFDPIHNGGVDWDLIVSIHQEFCEKHQGNGCVIEYESVHGGEFLAVYIPDKPTEEARIIDTDADRRSLKKISNLIKNYSIEYKRLEKEVCDKQKQIGQQLRELKTYKEVLGSE